ncbi:MAG TPA: hypothetical protein VKY74_23860 [Chloroflexia bacterium]|nr:hypothetical protein [Chloroflexia bacterium]
MHRSPTLARGLLLAATLLALLAAPFAGWAGGRPASAQATVPSNWIKGFVMIGYGPDPLKADNVPAALARLKATGANSVAFAPIWFMPGPTSTTMAPQPLQGTPSDDSVVAAIREAHRIGLRVMLRPYIDVSDGTWRADIVPSDVNAWFTSYTGFLDHYLDIGKAEGVEEFTTGVELINMTDPQYESRWRTLISHARTRYSGLLTYSANWGKHTRNEYKQIAFWDALDYIGISAYFPLSLHDWPNEGELAQGWTNYTDQVNQTYNWASEIKATADKFGKPVVFTEIGFASYSNSPARWDLPQHQNQLSLETQERAVAATLSVWSQQPWFHGLYWWHYEPYAGGGGANDNSDTLNNKPAEATITNWFGGSGQPPPTPNPTPNPPPNPDPIVQPLPPGAVRPAPSFGTASAGNPAFSPVPSPGPNTATAIYFPQTGHILQAAFLQYWQSHGGLAAFGYPISEAYQETNATDGKPYIVQYFERQRFEYHPEAPAAYRVLLGLLGVALVNGRTSGPFAGVPSPGPDTGDRVFFAPTGHTLSGKFLDYWNRYGGLPMFGYPLSEPFQEVSATDGKTYTVQYFERARFEYHPENAGSFYEVLLGFLGRAYAGAK